MSSKRFNGLQVLRTVEQLRNDKGHPVASGVRVVVIKQVGEKVFTRLADRPVGVTGRLPRIVGTPSQFARTFRGRPKGSTKSASVVASAPVVAVTRAARKR